MSDVPATWRGAREVVIATGNLGKLEEFRQLLGHLPLHLRSLAEFPDVQLPEEGDDYAENAEAKARTAAQGCGCIAIGDDSGLEVAGLEGRPGPHSARYGGPDLDDAGRAAALLRELGDATGASRRARFVCVAALAMPGGRVELSRGLCEGRILDAPRGEGGFGYDPIFQADGETLAMAELPEKRKNEISHRARALEKLSVSLAALARA